MNDRQFRGKQPHKYFCQKDSQQIRSYSVNLSHNRCRTQRFSYPVFSPGAFIISYDGLQPLGDSLNRKEEKEEIPVPAEIDKLDLEDGTLVIVEFDMLEYQKRHNSRAVKKTLSIPAWLNEEATAMGVNFSQVLREALMSKVNAGK